MEHHLEYDLIPEGVDGLAVGALQGHATELSSSCYPGSKCPNALVTLLGHSPHIHGVDSFVDLEDSQLLHGSQEQGRGGEGGVGAGVIDPLQQVCTAGSLYLLEGLGRRHIPLSDVGTPLHHHELPGRLRHTEGEDWARELFQLGGMLSCYWLWNCWLVTGAGVVGEEAVKELPGWGAFRGHKVTPWLRALHWSWRRHDSCQAMFFAWFTTTKRTSTGLGVDALWKSRRVRPWPF